MNRFDIGNIYRIFSKVFFVLLIILIVLPYLVDFLLKPLSNGTIPGNNSIIVFKEYLRHQEFADRFIKALRKIIYFM